MIFAVIAISVGIYLMYQLFSMLTQKSSRTICFEVIKSVRWWMVPVAIADIVTKIALVALLLNIEWLQWGWWKMLGGTGNVLLGQVSEEQMSTSPDHVAGVLSAIGVLAPIALFLLLPWFAYNEEDVFRANADKQSHLKRVFIAFVFGMIHLTVGIPIAAGIALTVSGLIYTTIRIVTVNRANLKSFGTKEAALTALKKYHSMEGPSHDAGPQELKEFNQFRAVITQNRMQSLIKTASVHYLSNAILMVFIALYIVLLLATR